MDAITLKGATNGANNALELVEPVTWTFNGHVRVAAFHDEMAGVEATTRNPHSFVTIEETTGFTRVTFDPARMVPRDRCGTYQIDVERWAGDSGADALFDFGSNCGSIIPPPHPHPHPVPEPGSLMLMALGLGLLMTIFRRRLHAA